MESESPNDPHPTAAGANRPGVDLRSTLIDRATRRSYAAGTVVIEQHSVVEHLFLVESGLLSVEVLDRHGRPLEVARYGPGDYCGEMSFLRAERAAATVRAVTDVDLWAVPHSVLGEIADRDPTVVRELASRLAARLSDTNLRFRQLRPGRAVRCVTRPRSQWALAFLAQVSTAAARHLRRPVLLLDLDVGETPAGIGAKVLPPLATLWQQPDQLAEYDAFAGSAGPVAGIVSRGDAATIDAGALLQTLTDLRRRYPLIVVRASHDLPLDTRLLTDLDGPVLLGEDESPPANGDSREPQNGAETIILRSGPAAASLRDLATLTRECGAQILRVVPGGRAALANERPGGSVGEPWDSVDWTARHFIKRKVGVALGAGGAKGYAHIGVLEELERMGVPIDYIAGTSIGAPIAAAVAAGWSLAEIKQHIDAISAHALRPTVPFSSFLSSQRVRREIERISEGKRFDELRLPLAVVAVDLERREEVVLTEGRVTRAIAASFAIPAIYPPVKIGGRSLVDGGLLNPVPIGTVANLGADTVIGVKLTSPVNDDRPRPRRFGLHAPPIVDTIVQAFEVMQWKITTEGAAQADVTIEPIFKGATGLREFSRGHEFIAVGRHAAAAARADIKAFLPWVGT